jgi:murein DD-endopeptidase MepM/ murein hydrolase activator NlpD
MKKQVFERKNDSLNEYLAQLDELLKRNRGGGLYEGFDVNPRAFRLPGRVVDPSGLGQDAMKDDLKYSAYEPGVIPMEARQSRLYFQPEFDLGQEEDPREDVGQEIDFNSHSGLQQVMQELTSIPVSRTEDGGLLYSNGVVRYDDGTSRQATRQDVPQVVRQFSDGSVLLTNGLFINPSSKIGRGYSGLAGLSDLIFGTQARVTQKFGNQNPKYYGPQGHRGVDFGTRDLPAEQRNIAFGFPVEVVQVIRAESGSPYGNSLLLQLPNGSMLRLSHLSDMENFSVGNTVRPFDYIGTPGNTGRSTAEHLDVEYYTPDGQLADPETFWLNSVDLIDTDAINQSLQSGKENLSPEDQQWVEAQEQAIAQGLNMTVDPGRFEAQAQQEQQAQQPQQEGSLGQTINEGIIQPIAQAPQQFAEAIQPMSPERQALAQVPEQLAQKVGVQAEFGLSEGIAGQDPMQARISALSRQPKEYNPYRQLLGNITERVGDRLGIPEGSFSETIAGGPTKRTNQALASQIGGEKPESVPGIRQNILDIGQDIGNRASQVVNPVLSKAGEGIEALKDKASNLFQKTPLMGLFEGQKQVGDTKGSTMIDTSGGREQGDNRDAFFKFGGADQYANYLIDNAEQQKGGALDTSLFKSDFFKDPNRIANVFGETFMGKSATDKYRDYLGEQVKPGFDEPYRTERRQEGDTLYEYKIPIEQYFQNQYFKNLISETPDVLKSGFSYDQFQLPTVTKSASEFKGETPVDSRFSPIFKSGAVDLFKRAGSKVGQLAGDIFKKPAPVYQGATPSMSYEIPQAQRSIFSAPAPMSVSIPSTQRTAISTVPKVSSGGSSGSSGSGSSRSSAPSSPNLASITPSVASRATAIQRAEQKQGGIKVGSGVVSTAPVKESSSSAQIKRSPSKSIFASAASWLKNLFRRR